MKPFVVWQIYLRIDQDAAVLKVVPHVLKYLYDEDVLEEEAVLKWHGTKSKGDAAKVKDAAKVFVEWLKYVSSLFLLASLSLLLPTLLSLLLVK